MKTLIVYYSKTGNTKKLAERLALDLKADLESLTDKKKRSGIIGWLMSGKDGMNKIPTEIEKPTYDPSAYDLVLLGGPLWGFKAVAPAARTYLNSYGESIKSLGLFMTRAGKKPSSEALLDLKEVYAKESIKGALDLQAKDLDTDAGIREIEKFVTHIKE